MTDPCESVFSVSSVCRYYELKVHKQLTDEILQCFFEVYNRPGYGFLEKVYENALMMVLIKKVIYAEKQKPVKVFYYEKTVG